MVDILSTLVDWLDWHDWFPTPNFLDPGCGDGGTIPAEELKVVMLGDLARTCGVRNAVTRPLRAPNHRFSVCNVHIQDHLDIHKILLSYLNVAKSFVV